MIEEAAGTRMYETKKVGSLQVMQKKEQKMAEIERMLTEEIQPTLEKLRKERSAFFEWQKNGMEIEHLTRLVHAYKYMQAEEFLNHAKEELEALQARDIELRSSLEKGQRDSTNHQQNIGIIEKKKKAELGSGLKALEDQANEMSKKVVKATEKWKSKKADREAEEANKESAIASVVEGETNIVTKQAEIETAKADYEKLVEAHAAAENALKDEERRQHAISMDMTEMDDGEAKTFGDQIQEAKTEQSKLATEVEQANMRIKHLSPLLKEKRAAAKGSEKELAKISVTLKKEEAAVKSIGAKMEQLDFDPKRQAQLETDQRQVRLATIPLALPSHAILPCTQTTGQHAALLRLAHEGPGMPGYSICTQLTRI